MIDKLKDEIDNYLKEYYKGKGTYNKIIYEASSYSLNVGGKRIRPIFAILTYRLYREDYREVLKMAAAIEMIHTYSLIHDDLPAMDNDDLRRGKPTNHKMFGEAMAILAGDALLNEAMEELFRYSLANGENALKASKVIAEAAGSEGMIGGQVVDILCEEKTDVTEEELRYMHSKKTGALIRASITSGAISAGAPEEDIDKLSEYGEKIGLAFQIQDDILDIIGDANKLGKNIHHDEEGNKTTFVTMFGLDRCKEMCKELTESCISILDSIDRDTTYLKEMTIKLLDREY